MEAIPATRDVIPPPNDLDDLRYNLAHLSVDAVRRFYEHAHEDCRILYDRLPSPKQIQTLVQVWKQLWRWL